MSVLRTPRLRLRLLHEDGEGDAALYAALYTDPVVMAHVLPPLPAGAAAHAFAVVCRHNRAARPGHRTWRIDDADRGGDAPAAAPGEGHGIAALHRDGDRAEIGVMLRPSSWGRGLAREALAALLAEAFGPMGLALVYGARPDDAQARRVDRMFGPLGLRRVPAPGRPGWARWELPRARWHGTG